MSTSKVSFTIRRPSPVSRAASSGADSDSGSSFKVPSLPRHLANVNDSTPGSPLARSTTSSPKPASRGSAYYDGDPDSSDGDEEDKFQDELVTGFDQFGVQRLQKKTKPKGPLIIPALQNRDWRELARKRRSVTQYVPSSAKARTGVDGSVGGLGVKDTINSGPVLVGLQVKEKAIGIKREDIEMEERSDGTEDIRMEEDEETEDQRALRAILAGTDGANNDAPILDIIPTPVSEADAYKQDVEELPDTATLEDYARVPVSQFGAALLRGMGWREGTAASRKADKGMIQPYLPEARPALLGIGAKEREALDDGGTKNKGSANQRPERRYVPVVKKERAEVEVNSERGGTPGSGFGVREKRGERSGSRKRGNGSAPASRRNSRSPDRHRDRDDRRMESRRQERDEYERERDRWKGDSDRDRPRERRRDRSRDSSRR